jgi:hypothetical protein
MRENPDIYDCSKCELMQQLDGLWAENAEAWKTYQLLCGRTVRDCQLEGWLLERWTQDWDSDRVIALLDRLDVIAGVLEPAQHGPTPTRHRRQ